MKQISSLQNPLIKRVLHLQEKSRDRKEENVFVIDGWKETQMAMENEFSIETILYREGFEFEEIIPDAEIAEVTSEVFDKISYRGNTSKVVSIAKQKSHSINKISLSSNPLIIVLDGIEKPGNLGAILLTADACGADAVICCDTQTDIYNPNVVRSSVGCLFSVPIAITDSKTCLKFLRDKNVQVFTTSLKAAKNYLDCDFKNGSAFV